MLLFKKKFLEAIRAGQKTQTIRVSKHCRFRPGQRSYIPGAGYITIETVDRVEWDALTDADAVPDGFETAEALRNEIRTLYADRLDAGFRLFKVVFRLLPPDEQARLIEERERRKREKHQDSRQAREQWFDETMKKLSELAEIPLPIRKRTKRKTVRDSAK